MTGHEVSETGTALCTHQSQHGLEKRTALRRKHRGVERQLRGDLLRHCCRRLAEGLIDAPTAVADPAVVALIAAWHSLVDSIEGCRYAEWRTERGAYAGVEAGPCSRRGAHRSADASQIVPASSRSVRDSSAIQDESVGKRAAGSECGIGVSLRTSAVPWRYLALGSG